MGSLCSCPDLLFPKGLWPKRKSGCGVHMSEWGTLPREARDNRQLELPCPSSFLFPHWRIKMVYFSMVRLQWISVLNRDIFCSFWVHFRSLYSFASALYLDITITFTSDGHTRGELFYCGFNPQPGAAVVASYLVVMVMRSGTWMDGFAV